MRIAILTTQCPFIVGGAELHARGLERALREEGHEAEIVSMPFKWYPAMTILDHILAARSLDVSEFNGVPIDLAICLKFPAYLMRHPNKTFWILHQHRQSYDLWDIGQSDLFDSDDGQIVRDAIRAADKAELGNGARVFANSNNVAKRLLSYNGVAATPLYHPPPLADRLTRGDFGDYFYYPSRLSRAKRQDFVLRSLALCSVKIRVIFSGAADDPQYGAELERLAKELGVDDRVEWRGFVSDEEMIQLYAGARGVLFTPIDEDLGYVALEAMLAGKPLLTLTDAGEPADLARNEVEGLVVPPEHAALAEAMTRIARSKDLAGAMGAAGLERYRDLDVSWAKVVAKLTAAPAKSSLVCGEFVARSVRSNNDVGAEERWSAPDSSEMPDGTASAALNDLGARYELHDHLARHRDYYETHWLRYRATLDLLARSGIKPKRILELGTSEPYVFSVLLKEAFPDAELTVIQESPAGLDWRYEIRGRDGRATDINLAVFGLNIETTRLPFDDRQFDLVIAMEVLEHLAIDPGFVFRETRRVLREDGALLVTTPNLVSLPGVYRALNGGSPYSFGGFVPWNGGYGRHNREYTPLEVESLGRYAGFETVTLKTADVYRREEVPENLVEYMAEHNKPLDLRGQNIFYFGRKNSGVSPGRYPATLYSADPSIFSGDIELRRTTTSGDGFIIRIANVSPLPWPATGPDRVRLTIDRVDQNGRLTADAQSLDLPHDLQPGGALEVPIRAIVGAGVGACWHEIGLYAEGRGPFRGAGRTKIVSIFATDLQPAPDLQAGSDAA
jgi:glycosyltransferase involved in cell wall biosynthesis/SAM-dependent methyltransferase